MDEVQYGAVQLNHNIRLTGRGLLGTLTVGSDGVSGITRLGDTVYISENGRMVEVPWTSVAQAVRVAKADRKAAKQA